MASVFIEPFDFQKIYVNYFLGNQELLAFALVLIVSFISAYLNLSNRVFLIILALSSLIMGAYLGQGIYVFTLFLIGFVVYRAFSSLLK